MNMKKGVQKSAMRPTVSDGDFSTANDGLSGNRVFVSFAKTINLGNYESMRVEFGVGRVVLEGQEFNAVTDACKDEALQSLSEMVKIIRSGVH